MTEHRGKSGSRPSTLGWFAFAVLGGAALCLTLLNLGSERGSYVVAVISMFLGILSLLVAVLGLVGIRPRGETPAGPSWIRRLWLVWRRQTRGAQLGYIAIFLIVSPALAWAVNYQLKGPALETADQVTVRGSNVLTPDNEVTLDFPMPTPPRDYVGLNLRLDGSGTGDCVGSTTLALRPIVNGAPQVAVRAAPGDETRLVVGGGARNLEITVSAPSMDRGCAVPVLVEGAVFYD